MAIQEIRPQNRREFMNKLIEPYDPKSGNPNQIFTEPYKAKSVILDLVKPEIVYGTVT
jgi:hypothetical protein